MARDGFIKPRKTVPIPADVDVVTTGPANDDEPLVDYGALTPVLYDPRRASNRDTRTSSAITADLEAEANAAWNAEHAAARTPSMRRALYMGQRLRENPVAVGAIRALQVPMFGLADESLAGIESALIPELRYEDAQRALEENEAVGARDNPWSARAGTLLGIPLAVGTGRLLMGPSAVPSASAASRIAGAAVRPGLIGASLGGVGGYLHAPEGEELGSALRGAATGGIIGATGGALTGAGGAMRAAISGPVRGAVAGGVAEGAGYGLMGTPGMSSADILHPGDLADDAPLAMLAGGTIGGLAGAGGRFLSAPSRAVADIQEGIARRAPRTRGPTDAVPVDEALLDSAALAADADEAVGALGPRPDEVAAQAIRDHEAEPWFSRLVRESLERNPVYSRFNSVGITERPQIRQITRAFGGEGRALAALRRAGLARPGVYSQSSQQRAADAVRTATEQDLERMHAAVTADRRLIPGSDVADRLETAARPYSRPSSSDREASIAAAIRRRAQQYRYGRDVLPETEVERLSPVGDGLTLEAPVTELPPELALDYPELRLNMRGQGAQNRRAYSGAPGTLTPEQEAGVDIYRAEQATRDAELAATHGEDAYRNQYLPRNAAYRAARIVAPPPEELSIQAARNPADFRGSITGAMRQGSNGSIIDRIAGNLEERLIGQYRDSIMATINEVGTHTPEELALIDSNMVHLLEWASRPGPDIRIGSLRIPRNARAVSNAIINASRSGAGPTVIAALSELAQPRTLARAETSRASMPESRAAERAAIEAYARDRDAQLLNALSPRAAAQSAPREEAAPDAERDHEFERSRDDLLMQRLRAGRPRQ